MFVDILTSTKFRGNATMTRDVSSLKKIISIYGAAQVAVWLNYRDTRPINQWLSRNKIPENKVEAVKHLIKKQKKGELRANN